MKIGIFGGCFNPPHNMHKNIALELIKQNYVEKVIYIPTSGHYNKKDLIDFKNRFKMLELMISNHNNLELSDIEESQNKEKTYQVLDYFHNEYPNAELYFICGSDNLNELEMWKNYEYILKNYNVLVIKRNTDNIEDILTKYNSYQNSIVVADINIQTLSSTYIRNNINNNIKDFLDEKVYNYIKDNHLYE